MFFVKSKNAVLEIHEKAIAEYNKSYREMCRECELLYYTRKEALNRISKADEIINSIANSPKDFEKRFGEINQQVKQFAQTEEYAEEAYTNAVISGASIFAGVAASSAFSTVAPHVAMEIALNYGTTQSGKAISTLPSKAAQKAAVAWIGRMTKGIATKGVVTGAGTAAGKSFLSLAGPISWTISGATTVASLASLSSKNLRTTENVKQKTKEIIKQQYEVSKKTQEVINLNKKITACYKQMDKQILEASKYEKMSYSRLNEQVQIFLHTFVNNTYSLSAMLNTTIK